MYKTGNENDILYGVCNMNYTASVRIKNSFETIKIPS